jgi:hypothetical protein
VAKPKIEIGQRWRNKTTGAVSVITDTVESPHFWHHHDDESNKGGTIHETDLLETFELLDE